MAQTNLIRPTFDYGPFCGDVPFTNVQRQRLWEMKVKKVKKQSSLSVVKP